MKKKTIFLTSLLCLCGAAAQGSECVGAGCNIGQMYPQTVGTPTILAAAPVRKAAPVTVPVVAQYAQPVEYVYQNQIPMRQVKMLSIKPVPNDNRPPVWDGTAGNYDPRGYDKTVDWRDGVPIWDDSISDYKKKDFTDWFLQPMDELYIRQADEPTYVAQVPYTAGVSAAPTISAAIDESCANATEEIDINALYNQNMADAAATRARVEELLSPRKPSGNLWIDSSVAEIVTETPAPEYVPAPVVAAAAVPVAQPLVPVNPKYVAQDMTEIVKVTFGRTDGCPFESETECEIWRRKPMIRETVAPRSPKIRDENMQEFISAAKCNKQITADAEVAAPLLNRYQMLMRSANACCTDGMAYALKQAGASDGLVYKFLADDANFYGLGARCLMMSDADFDAKYPNTATAAVAADVRNGCLCRGRQWFSAMLAPFVEVYNAAPEFAKSKFNYTYKDGLQREITVSINNDVQNVLNQLALCP